MTQNTNEQKTDLMFDPADFTETELNEGEATEAKATETEPKEAPQKIKIKYNGADEEYTQEELITLAQKGRNYDPIKEKYEGLKNSETTKRLKELTEEGGFKSEDEFLESLKTKTLQEKLDKRVAELEADGVPTSHAKHMAELELSKPIEAKPNPFEKLFQRFPETSTWTDLSQFPDDVRKSIEEGDDPLLAYAAHKAKVAEDEKERVIAEYDASKRSTGSLQTNAVEKEEDEFLKGFLGK